MAEVMIRVAKSALRAAKAKVRTAKGTDRLGQGRCQEGPGQLQSVGVRVQAAGDAGQPSASWTFRFATRPTASSRRPPPHATRRMAMVSETTSAHDQAIADRERAEVDVESARAELEVGRGRGTRRPRARRIRQDQGPVRRRDHPAQRQPGRLPAARCRLGRPAAVRSRADRPAARVRRRARAGLVLHPPGRYGHDPPASDLGCHS